MCIAHVDYACFLQKYLIHARDAVVGHAGLIFFVGLMDRPGPVVAAEAGRCSPEVWQLVGQLWLLLDCWDPLHPDPCLHYHAIGVNNIQHHPLIDLRIALCTMLNRH